jgi:hypothetical protein
MTSFAWATKRLFSLRIEFGPSDENEWAFGQVFPLVLLAAPVATLLDHWPGNQEVNSGQDNIETSGAETEPSLPVRQDDDQLIDQDYESSLSFRLGTVIVGISYIYLVILVLTTDAEGLSPLVSRLAFHFFLLYPCLEATWFLYALWIPKLDFREVRQSALLDIMFLTIIFLMVAQMSNMYFAAPLLLDQLDYDRLQSSPSIVSQVFFLAMLFAVYFIFVSWFGVADRHRDHNRMPPNRARLSRLTNFAACIVLLAMLAAFLPTSPIGVSIVWGPMAFGGQIFVHIVEASLHARVQASRQMSFRGWFLMLSLLGLQPFPILFRSYAFEILFSVLLSCAVQILFWICYGAFRK